MCWRDDHRGLNIKPNDTNIFPLFSCEELYTFCVSPNATVVCILWEYAFYGYQFILRPVSFYIANYFANEILFVFHMYFALRDIFNLFVGHRFIGFSVQCLLLVLIRSETQSHRHSFFFTISQTTYNIECAFAHNYFSDSIVSKLNIWFFLLECRDRLNIHKKSN